MRKATAMTDRWAEFDAELGDESDVERPEDKPAPSTDIVLFENFELDREEHDLIEGGLIEDRGLHYIIGAPGAAKTFFALAAGVAVASGTDFLGRKTTQAGVFYLAAERPDSIMLRSFALRKTLSTNRIPFALIKSPVDLGNTVWLNSLAADLIKFRETIVNQRGIVTRNQRAIVTHTGG